VCRLVAHEVVAQYDLPDGAVVIFRIYSRTTVTASGDGQFFYFFGFILPGAAEAPEVCDIDHGD
jgi:hypothetical protein